MSVYDSLCLSLYLSVSLYLSQSVHPSLDLPLLVHLSPSLYVCMCAPNTCVCLVILNLSLFYPSYGTQGRPIIVLRNSRPHNIFVPSMIKWGFPFTDKE